MLLNIGFAIELRNIKISFGLLCYMVERRENQPGNTNSLAYISYILALDVFNITVHGLPVVAN